MDYNLEAFDLDLVEILEDLRLHWVDNELSKYNDTALTKLKDTGENLMFCCPHHHERNPSCGIKTDYPFGWNCFSCGASGNLPQLVAHVMGYRNELYGMRYITKNYLVTTSKERPALDIDSILDGNDLERKRSLDESEVAKFQKKRHSYIQQRGFSDRTIRKYEVGYDEETQSITFPVRTSKGNIRFIKKRFVAKKGFLNEKGIDKKDIVYGLYYILQSPTEITRIKLTESETDTMACYEGKLPSGAILGRLLFKEQVRELLLAGIKEVDLFLDNDKHGVNATIQAYEMLSRTPIKVNVVLYPGIKWGIDTLDEDEVPHKDANDLLKAGKMGDILCVPYENWYMMLKQSVTKDTTNNF